MIAQQSVMPLAVNLCFLVVQLVLVFLHNQVFFASLKAFPQKILFLALPYVRR